MSAVIIKGGNARCSIAPWLSVRKSSQAVAFYQAAFDAKEVFRLESETGSVIARLSIDGAEFWVGDESPEHANFSPQTLGGGTVRMILSVTDPDAIFAKVVATGATAVHPVAEQHGWRIGRLVDPYGHHWEIARELNV